MCASCAGIPRSTGWWRVQTWDLGVGFWELGFGLLGSRKCCGAVRGRVCEAVNTVWLRGSDLRVEYCCECGMLSGGISFLCIHTLSRAAYLPVLLAAQTVLPLRPAQSMKSFVPRARPVVKSAHHGKSAAARLLLRSCHRLLLRVHHSPYAAEGHSSVYRNDKTAIGLSTDGKLSRRSIVADPAQRRERVACVHRHSLRRPPGQPLPGVEKTDRYGKYVRATQWRFF